MTDPSPPHPPAPAATRDALPPVVQAKAELRRRLLRRRRDLPPEERQRATEAITRHLMESRLLHHVGSVLAYWACGSEVGTEALIRGVRRLGVQVFLPRLTDLPGVFAPALWVEEESLELGPYNLYQPRADPSRSLAEPELILVPGVGFDERGHRLGHGKGYYDRYLARRAEDVLTIGVGFELQVVESVPVEPHDLPLDFLVTELGLRKSRRT